MRAFAEIPAPQPRPWPADLRPLEVVIHGAGRTMGLEEWLDATWTTALVVVRDGVLVHERYLRGTEPGDRLLGNSATKSALALVTGLAVDAGLLSVDDPAVKHVPELAGTGYAGVTVEHLLSMTTAVGWVENHRDPDGLAARLVGAVREGTGRMRAVAIETPPGAAPGSRYEYCTADSVILDWVRERATERSFADVLGDLWREAGAEHPAIVGLDAPDGVAMAGGALAATARDWARLGALQIDGGGLVSEQWVAASSRPSKPFLAPGRLPSTITTHAGFGWHWWPLDADGSRVTADGMVGQFVYVDRRTRTVVVKMSAWPYEDAWADRQYRDLSYLGLQAIAATVGT